MHDNYASKRCSSFSSSSHAPASRRRSLLAVLVLAAAATACGASETESAGTSPAPATPAPQRPSDPAATPPAPPPAPPLDGTPVADEINESFGIFVATSGSASGDGSRKAPLATIKDGLTRAKAAGKRIYVCEGTYAEAITIEKGIGMVGGFDCSTDPMSWKKTSKSSRVDAPSSPAITATDIDVATRFEGFDVYAPDGTAASPSSIGLLAKHAPSLTIAACKITSGRGADGAAGSEGVQLSSGPSLNGSTGLGEATTVLGQFSPRSGAVGGAGQCLGAAGFDGGNGGAGGSGGVFYCREANYPTTIYPSWTNLVTVPTPGVVAGGGAAGAAGKDGVSAGAGTLTADGFTAGDGVGGTNGAPGAGGDGGGGGTTMGTLVCTDAKVGTYAFGATGSGGGAGGCPGLAGSAGKGGGASIAALVSNSDGLVFASTNLNAGVGGAGGRGALGSMPTAGGQPGTKIGGSGAAQPGGAGGRAGVSGSGAGGPSYGIAFKDAAPKLTDGSVAKAGKGGPGVAAESVTDPLGNTKTRAASADGATQDMHDF